MLRYSRMLPCLLLLAFASSAIAQDYNFVRPQRTVVLSAEQTGVITRKPYESQDFVNQGELLVQLDPNLVELELQKTLTELNNSTIREKAAIRLEYAQQNYEIVENLYETTVGETRVGSPKELWEARQTRDLAKLEVLDATRELRLLELNAQQLRKRLQQLALRAPFDGVVVPFASVKQVPNLENAKAPERGETVQVAQPVVALMRVDRLRVPWSVPVQLLGDLRLRQQVRLFVPHDDPEPITGEVVFISPTVDSVGRVAMEIEFQNPTVEWTGPGERPAGWYRYRFRPGMSARVEFQNTSNDPPAGA